MYVVILLVFISLGLVTASLFFFMHRLREGDFDHADRLALAPLDDDPPPVNDGAAGDGAAGDGAAGVHGPQADNHACRPPITAPRPTTTHSHCKD